MDYLLIPNLELGNEIEGGRIGKKNAQKKRQLRKSKCRFHLKNKKGTGT